MDVFGYLASLLVGISLGILGGGGSILMVPILVYLFSIPALKATHYSLFIVGFTSAIGMINYAKQKLVDFRTGLIFFFPSFAGVLTSRRILVPALPNQIELWGAISLTKNSFIMIAFASVMLAASYSMIKPSKPKLRHDVDHGKVSVKNVILIGIQGFFVGIVTGFVGAGGGFLIVPALVLLLNIPMKEAVGTGLMIIALNSLFGFFGGGSGGEWAIEWGFLAIVSGLAVVGIVIGSYLSRFVPSTKLKPAFGWFVLVMGSYILLKEIL